MFKTLLFFLFLGYSSLAGCDKHNRVLHENNQSKEINFLHVAYTTPKDKFGFNGCHHIYAIDMASRLALLNGTTNMMNDFMVDTLFLSSQPRTKQHFESNLSICEELEGMDTSVLDVDEEIEFINKDIISIKALTYIYGAGAAHGNAEIHHKTYSRKTGMLLDWNTLFKDKSIDKYIADRVMNELVSKEYLAYLEKNSEANMMVNAIGVDTKSAVMHFRKVNYFAIVKEGLEIQYHPYEIAPFVAGSPSLSIKKEILKPYMNKKMYEMCFGEKMSVLE